MQNTTEEKPRTCADLIPEKYHREMDTIKEALDHGHSEDNQVGSDVQTMDQYQDQILGVKAKIKMEILCSWGGPSDGFNLTVDPEERTIESAEYFYRDWFDGATKEVPEDELTYIRKMFGFIVDVELGKLCRNQ